MTTIRIDTDEVMRVGGQFNTKAGELETLIKQAQSLMNSLEAGWQGVRKTTTFAEWQGMQKNLVAAVETLQATSRILKQASTEFDTVDKSH